MARNASIRKAAKKSAAAKIRTAARKAPALRVIHGGKSTAKTAVRKAAVKASLKATTTMTQPNQIDPNLMDDDFTGDMSAVLGDTSMVIVDRDALRAQAIEAMGAEIVNKALGDGLLTALRKGKRLYSDTHMVHILDLNIDHNPRSFVSEDRKKRVLWMANNTAARGVKTPIETYLKDEKLFIVGGGTRERGVLLSWVLKAKGVLNKATTMVKVTVADKNTNDFGIAMARIDSNEVDKFTPLDLARAYQIGLDTEATAEEIAAHRNRSVSHVTSTVAYLGMPKRILNLVDEGAIKVGFAWKVWNEEGNDPDRAYAVIKESMKTATMAGADRAMPKHLEVARAALEDRSPTTGKGTGTRSAPAKTAGGKGSAAQGSNGSVAEALKRTLDTVSAGGTGAEVRYNGEGKIVIELPQEDYLSFASKIGWPIPKEPVA